MSGDFRRASQPRSRYRQCRVLRALIFLSLCVLSVSGCAVPHPPSPVSAVPSVLPSAQQLLATLEQRRHTLTSLRGLARVVYADSQDKGGAEQAVAVAAPDRFRLELFSPLGIASLVTSDGQRLAAYFPQEKTLYRGAATPLTTARFLRVMLGPREIASFLLGLPALPVNVTPGTVEFDAPLGRYRLTLTLPDRGRHLLWFDPQTLLLLRWEIQASDGTTVGLMTLNNYRAVDGWSFPFEIVLSDLHSQQKVSLFYIRAAVNPSLPQTLFELPQISGVKEIDIDALAAEERQ